MRHAGGFWLAAATYLVLLAGTNIPNPLYGHYAAAFGFGPATVTAVFAVYVAALTPSLLFVGPLSDAIGRRAVLLPAIALGIAGAALLAAAALLEVANSRHRSRRSRMAHRTPDPERLAPHRSRRPPARRSRHPHRRQPPRHGPRRHRGGARVPLPPERIQAIGRNASELIDRHRRIPETAGTTTVQLLLHTRHGRLTHQGTTTWAELLAARAGQHLPGHAHTLRRIAGLRP
jgi:hypothetical protein